jgi:hypothetical protein
MQSANPAQPSGGDDRSTFAVVVKRLADLNERHGLGGESWREDA